ncbi:hypothetical protein PG985_014304 [Apiospora marii]|uniref:uncharacterized protein n=1 Tax=Apiospora marii TaxID=335849 RepID=UPI00312E3BEE
MDSQTDTTLDADRIIQILIWFIFTAATLSAVIGLGMKYIMVRMLGPDDWLTILAQVRFTLAPPPGVRELQGGGRDEGDPWAGTDQSLDQTIYLGECIATSFGASAGLGRPWASLSKESQDTFLKVRYADIARARSIKTEYASTILLILSLAIVKWSILVFIKRLSQNIVTPRTRRSVSAFVGLWFVTATITSIFQCAIPTPWDYVNGHRCLDRRAWWAYVSVVNVLTELCIAGLYLLVMYKVQISRSKKVVVLSLFLTRLLVVAAAIAQLVTFFQVRPNSDLTLSLKTPVLLNQTTLSVSVITACVPYFKPFMESINSEFVIRVPSIGRSEDGFSDGSVRTDSYLLFGSSNSAACHSIRTS